jgi:hypothetical protein
MHRRAAAALLVACALSAILGAPFAPGGAATPPRSAQVTPAGNLRDQVVRVTWEHFRPTRSDGTFSVVIMECIAHPTSVLADCNTGETFPLSLAGNQQPGTTEADGTGSAFFDVESTARLPALGCSAEKPCSLLLYEQTASGFDPNGLPPDMTTTPLTFRKSAADCPPVTHFDVRAEAEASAATALYQLAGDVCAGKGAFTVDVTNTSSNSARKQFFSGNVDVGVTSLPPQQVEVPAGTPAYTVTPVDLTGIVVAYNIMDPVTKQKIRDIKLTPRLVARLVSDTDVLTFFDDPEFKKLNPHHHFPLTAADPGVRAEQNADTWIVTNWLNSDPGARNFLNGHDKYGIHVNQAWKGVHYPTDVFEARNPNGVYLPRTGEDTIGQRLFYATKPADSVQSPTDEVGFFGLVDLPTARRYNLPMASLTRGVGQPVVAPTDAAIQESYRDMTVSTKGFHVERPLLSDPLAYPLSKVDHALTLKNIPDNITAARIKYLLAYAVGPGQATLPPGFVPFPGALPPPTSTTTTTTTTTTTAPPGGSGSFGNGYSSSPIGGSSNTVATTPTTIATVSHTTRRSAAKPKIVTPRLQLISQNDGLALPIVLVLGILASAYCVVDVARRRGRGFIGNTRKWIATKRASA